MPEDQDQYDPNRYQYDPDDPVPYDPNRYQYVPGREYPAGPSYMYVPPPSGPSTPTVTIETEGGEQETIPLAEGLNPAQSQFNRGVLRNVDVSYQGQARQRLLDAGVDISNEIVHGMLMQIGTMSPRFEENPALFETVFSGLISGLQQQGILAVTPYSQALTESGFGFEDPTFNEVQLGDFVMTGRGHSLADFEGEGIDFVTNEQTGWVQWKDGTLVNPNYEIGNVNAVVFEPNSRAPGSRLWLNEVVPTWSPGKINEWRGKLIEGGYLDSASKKGPVDVQFLNAMQMYQVVKYQHGGTPMAIGPQLPGGTGTTPFNFKQLQGQIRADIRTQWNAIYGQTPTDDEIEPYQDMVIRTAHRLYKKGQLSASQAAVEAEERMIARMESSPEAQFVTSNVEENTELRDQILRAVQVTSAMSG